MSANLNYFNRKKRNIPLSHYNRIRTNSFDMNFGEVVPFLMEDVMPGDKFKVTPEIYAKMAPLVAPIHGNIKLNVRYFFVPYELVYRDWDKMFMGAAGDAYEVPRFTPSSATEYQKFYKRHGRLYSHMGLAQDDGIYTDPAVPVSYPPAISILPLRAYQQIMYYYYLDHRKYSQSKLDEFRSYMCLDGAANYGTADTYLNLEGRYIVDYNQNDPSKFYNTRGFWETQHVGDFAGQVFPTVNKITVSSGSTITDIQTGKNLQQFFTNMLKSGRNYFDYLARVFGQAPDERINQPVYLGGNSSSLIISEVTALTEAIDQPLGSFAGRGFTKNESYAEYEFNDYGFLIGLMDCTPSIAYANRHEKRVFQLDQLDFPRLEFVNNFYEEVYLSQLYYNHQSSIPSNSVIGYTAPYNELRYPMNMVRGKFATDLDYWNIINRFTTSIETLSVGQVHDYYVTESALNRQNLWHKAASEVLAVPTEPQLYMECINVVSALRPIPHVQQDLLA